MADRQSDLRRTQWPISWCIDVVGLTGVHEEGRAEIRWHTTWQHDAQNLADLVGLPAFRLPKRRGSPRWHTERRDRGRQNGACDGLPAWWKYGAARRCGDQENR
jgi:hypothetical protein